MDRVLAATLALSAALPAGCGGGEAAAGSGAPPGPPTLGPGGGGGDTSFLRLMSTAHLRVAYRGTKRVELYHQESMIYREDVGSDGQGLFSVECLEVITPIADPAAFKEAQNRRKVLVYEYRDFRIRDYPLFQQNFTVNILDPDTTVAGRSCVRIDAARNVGTPTRHYIADVDPTNGLVMGYEELAADGSLLARVEFETFVLDGDVSDMDLVERVFQTEAFPLEGTDFSKVFGFQPLIPTLPPDSLFQVEPRVEKMTVPAQAGLPQTIWCRVYLTDGLEQAILMHRKRVLTPATGFGKLGRVEFSQAGSWCVLQGEVKGYPVVCAGKFSRDDLALMLQSALPK